jgi:hypothetical protein
MVDLTTCLFDLDEGKPTVVVAVILNFFGGRLSSPS